MKFFACMFYQNDKGKEISVGIPYPQAYRGSQDENRDLSKNCNYNNWDNVVRTFVCLSVLGSVNRLQQLFTEHDGEEWIKQYFVKGWLAPLQTILMFRGKCSNYIQVKLPFLFMLINCNLWKDHDFSIWAFWYPLELSYIKAASKGAMI